MKIVNFLLLLFLPLLTLSQSGSFKLIEEPSVDSFPKVSVKFNLRSPEIKPQKSFKLYEDTLIQFSHKVLTNSKIPETKNVLILVENLRFRDRNKFYKDVLKNSVPHIVEGGDNINIALFDRVHNDEEQQILFFNNESYTDNPEQLLNTVEDIPELPGKSSYNNTYSYNRKDVNVESSDLYFAIYSGLKKLYSDFPGGNNFLVVLSTAFNNKNSSHVSTQTAMEFAKRKDIPVYSVQFRIQGYEGHKLTELCYETYGDEVISNHPGFASGSLNSFMERALERSQGVNYELTYNSTYPRDGKLHNTTIEVDSELYGFTYYTPEESIIKRLWNNHRYTLILSIFLITLLLALLLVYFINSWDRRASLKKQLYAAESGAEAALLNTEHLQSEFEMIQLAEQEKNYREKQKKLNEEILAEMRSAGSLPLLQYRFDNESGEFNMDKPIIRIGRSKSNDLILNDPYVSRQHSEIYFSGGYYFIRDINSTSGTFVNGNKIESEILKHGDIIKVGGVEIYFKL